MKDKISKLKNLVKKVWVGRNDKKGGRIYLF
mgnify:FL=1